MTHIEIYDSGRELIILLEDGSQDGKHLASTPQRARGVGPTELDWKVARLIQLALHQHLDPEEVKT